MPYSGAWDVKYSVTVTVDLSHMTAGLAIQICHSTVTVTVTVTVTDYLF